MAWISAGPGYHAAKQGHEVVMAPGQHTYFDMKESGLDTFGHWWAGIVPLSKVYDFDLLARDDLPPEAAQRIMGVHGCLWTSQFRDDWTVQDSVDYRTWPRLCALAEVGWTPQEARDWDDFRTRLGRTHLARLAELGMRYRMPEAQAVLADGGVVIQSLLPGTAVHYTTDRSEPDASSTRWAGQAIAARVAGQLRTRAVGPGGRVSHVAEGVVRSPRGDYPMKPEVTVEASMPAYGAHAPSQAADWKGGTFFWSNRKGRAGDTMTFTFTTPLLLREVELATGKLNNVNLDNVVDGDLLVSYDGVAFDVLAPFSFGVAKANMEEKPVRALQVKLNADHDTWIVVQDPVLYPADQGD